MFGRNLRLKVGVMVQIRVRVKSRAEGGRTSCPMNQSQNGMAQSNIYTPFHCGTPCSMRPSVASESGVESGSG